MDTAALVSTTQIWEKSKGTITLLIVTALMVFVNIHNEMAVMMGSFMVLIFTLYISNLTKKIEYNSFKTQLSLLSNFITPAATILVLSIFARLFSSFLAESGTLTIETLRGVFVVFGILITLYGILPNYLWLYYNHDDNYTKH